MEEERLTWKVPEYTYREHSPDWFWAVGIVGLGLAVTAVILDNVFFAVLLFVATATLLLQALKRPRMLELGIGERGIRVDKTLYPYTTLETFWISEDEPPHLLVRSQKTFLPLLVIPLGNADSMLIRETLLEFILEEELQEPFTQKIMERLGF